MPAVIYRWFDILGNENVQFAEDFDKKTHEKIIEGIMYYKDRFHMTNRQLRLIVTIIDKHWVSYNMVKPGDVVTTWRTHKN
jgi:hypothetical protein